MNNQKQIDVQRIMLVCYGNILRSQVLEQYMKLYILNNKLDIIVSSAGVAAPEEFPDKEKLFMDISAELRKRNIPHTLFRNPWDNKIQERATKVSLILCADLNIKDTVKGRMVDYPESKILTFYQAAGEGEKSFEDTYDYDNNRQDPIKFANAFSELERLSSKIISNLTQK